MTRQLAASYQQTAFSSFLVSCASTPNRNKITSTLSPPAKTTRLHINVDIQHQRQWKRTKRRHFRQERFTDKLSQLQQFPQPFPRRYVHICAPKPSRTVFIPPTQTLDGRPVFSTRDSPWVPLGTYPQYIHHIQAQTKSRIYRPLFPQSRREEKSCPAYRSQYPSATSTGYLQRPFHKAHCTCTHYTIRDMHGTSTDKPPTA